MFRLRTAIFTLITLFCALSAEDMNFSRKNYGTTHPTIWSPLTPFELSALTTADAAKKGDPEALFKLGILASGDVRDQRSFDKFHYKVTTFIAKNQRDIRGLRTQREKAELIFDRMLTTFFPHSGKNNRIKGYQFSQSQLTGIFKTEKFNCVSSSMLYMILLRYYSIPVKGVVVPGHIFVQIETVEGDTIEVETTSERGFGYEHTKESVTQRSRSWFEKRGLPYYGWKEYLNREIVSPYDIVYRNFRNQHTSPQRMAYADRMRLVEMRYFLEPQESESFQDIVAIYNNEYVHLRNTKQQNTRMNFYKIAHPFIQKEKSRAQNDTTQLILLSMELDRIGLALDMKKYKKGYEVLVSFLRSIPREMKNSEKLQNNTLYTVHLFYDHLMSKGQIEDILMLLKATEEGFDKRFPKLESYYFKLYHDLALQEWNKKNWKESARLMKEAKRYAHTGEQKKSVNANIGSVYYNWAALEANAKNFDEALKITEECLRYDSSCKPCKSLKKKIVKFAK